MEYFGVVGILGCTISGGVLVYEFSDRDVCNIGSHHVDSTAYCIFIFLFGIFGGLWTVLRGGRAAGLVFGLALYLSIFAGATVTCHDTSTGKVYDDRFPVYDVFSPLVFVACIGIGSNWITSSVPTALSGVSAVVRCVGFVIWSSSPTLPGREWGRSEHALFSLTDVSVYKNEYFLGVAIVGALFSALEVALIVLRHRFANFLHFSGVVLAGAYLWGQTNANGLWNFPISHHNYYLVWGSGVMCASLLLDVVEISWRLRAKAHMRL